MSTLRAGFKYTPLHMLSAFPNTLLIVSIKPEVSQMDGALTITPESNFLLDSPFSIIFDEI
jgi:hypothetical protein